jgi:hypothetical protein
MVLNQLLTHSGWSHPELMIPYNHSPRFLLVSGSQLVQFDNVLTQHPTITQSDINLDGLNWPPRYPGSSDRLPVFTAWVHATRSTKFADEEREELYLLREDGILYGATAEQKFGGTSGMSSFRQVARFNCNGSGAMASVLLTQSLKDPDTLVVWGDMSDGEMVSVCFTAPSYCAC